MKGSVIALVAGHGVWVGLPVSVISALAGDDGGGGGSGDGNEAVCCGQKHARSC